MSTDNRTQINDCEANTGWSGDDTANPISDAGSFIEGSGALSTQLSNADEHMYTTQDSVGASTFNLDWSNSTLYMNIKDNLNTTYALGGTQFVISDGTNTIGYAIGGNDAVGMPYKFFYAANKLDVSVIVTTPGNFATYAGTEANLAQTASTGIGYASLHTAKAVGSVDNVIMDGFYYIANGSYALTINGGTSGTPETMADVAADDETNGWGLVSNPFGSQYIFFGPTEFGEATAAANHYFKADGEQWYWIGDNAGGHAVGATHFPFRVIGNTTDIGSFIINSVAIVNTGTGAEFDCSSTNVETLEIDTCSMSGLASFNAPSVGGTSRFCTSTIFTNCGQITHNGASMNGCSILTPTVAAGSGAVLYNLAADPDGEMDNMTFSQGTNAHSAIEFGTSVTADITLRGMDFTGFGSTDDVNGAIFKFLATTGSLNLNLVGCTTDGTFSVDDSAGITVTVIISPVTEKVNVKDTGGTNIQNARVLVETAEVDAAGEIFEAAVTSLTQSAGTAVCTTTAAHGLVTGDKVVIRGAQPDGYNKVATVTVSSTTVFTYTVSSSLSSPATGTPVVSFVALHGLTDVNGDISASRTWTSAQAVKGWVRKINAVSPFYKQGDIAYTIDTTNGNTTNVVLQPDE